jgi:hypothetical protein
MAENFNPNLLSSAWASSPARPAVVKPLGTAMHHPQQHDHQSKRSEMLRAEHERAMGLLTKEKAAAAAIAAAAQEKGRRVEAALQAVALAHEDLDVQRSEHQERVGEWHAWHACV